MKKEYTTPEVEKVEFNYREQVVASPDCNLKFENVEDSIETLCKEWIEVKPLN